MGQHIAIVAAGVAAIATVATAQPLTGTGIHLPIPGSNPGAPNGIGNTLVSGGGGFTGTWTSPVLAPWVGTYIADGPIPSSNLNPAGITRYDFTPLPTGVLPSGTFFFIGDVDGGSTTTEQFIINAFDGAGALITTPWLDMPIGVTPLGTSLTQMPEWIWDGGTGTYTFNGNTVVGNPSVGIWMPSNTDIATMILNRPSNFANFNLWAPVPAPSTVALLGLAGFAVRRRR